MQIIIVRIQSNHAPFRGRAIMEGISYLDQSQVVISTQMYSYVQCDIYLWLSACSHLRN